MIIWLSGLSGAGKTTIARELLKHIDAHHIDGDDLRGSVNKGLGFTHLDRTVASYNGFIVARYMVLEYANA